MKTTPIIRNKKRLSGIIVAILLCFLFIHLRYVCDPSQQLRTFLFFSYSFFLFTPCLYLILKVLFPASLRIFFFTFYLLLTLFPYKIFYPATTDLCKIYTYPIPETIFGLNGYWVLIIYSIFSLIITLCWLRYHHKHWTRSISQKEVVICGLLLLVTAVQILPRLSENSPAMVGEGVHRNKELCGRGGGLHTVDLFGYCVNGDEPFWLRPNGFFKGVNLGNYRFSKGFTRPLGEAGIPEAALQDLEPLKWQEFERKKDFLEAVEKQIGREQTVKYQELLLETAINYDGYAGLVANRRILCPYLYSLLAPFIHPYYATILVNGTFFYLILLSGYVLAKFLNLHNTVAFVFPVLLSAHYRLLFFTIDVWFYVPKVTFFFLILVIGYKLQIFSKPVSLTNKVLFCTVLACSALVYDPHLKVGFVFLWGLFYVISQLKKSRTRAGLTLLHTIVYAVVPLVAQESCEKLLEYYELTGRTTGLWAHADAAEIFLSRLPVVPSFIVHNFEASVVKVSDELTRLIVLNPLNSEYLKIFGVFGLLCFFMVLPKYIKGEHLKGIYALYLAVTIIIPLIAAFIVQIPPADEFGFLDWTSSKRAVGYLLAFPLAQSIGLYHFAGLGCRWMPNWLKPKYLIYLITIFVFIFSYHRLLILY